VRPVEHRDGDERGEEAGDEVHDDVCLPGYESAPFKLVKLVKLVRLHRETEFQGEICIGGAS